MHAWAVGGKVFFDKVWEEDDDELILGRRKQVTTEYLEEVVEKMSTSSRSETSPIYSKLYSSLNFTSLQQIIILTEIHQFTANYNCHWTSPIYSKL
jgi:hypothetical protein